MDSSIPQCSQVVNRIYGEWSIYESSKIMRTHIMCMTWLGVGFIIIISNQLMKICEDQWYIVGIGRVLCKEVAHTSLVRGAVKAHLGHFEWCNVTNVIMWLWLWPWKSKHFVKGVSVM
jgi:hypothetical protein